MPPTHEIYTLSLHDALPISNRDGLCRCRPQCRRQRAVADRARGRAAGACRAIALCPDTLLPPDRSFSMSAVRFTKDHEWVRQEGDVAVIGITDYAQSQLGDVVYVELPELGRQGEQGKEAAVVDSAKAASEVYAPVSREVVAVNDDIGADPAQVHADAMGAGWLISARRAALKQLDGRVDGAAVQSCG